MVYYSVNPVHSVLFLILAFVNASFILILFQIEFLALLFIIIYVGAIAVLFLFIVMMLNIKKTTLKFTLINKYLVFSLLISLILFFKLDIIFNAFGSEISSLNNIFYIDFFSDIFLFGQSLYNYNLVLVLLSGLILLVAMIGAIILTLEFKSINFIELSARQLARSSNTIKLFF
jgi:NADH-quinone oxidoreductase subunit J